MNILRVLYEHFETSLVLYEAGLCIYHNYIGRVWKKFVHVVNDTG